jgi:hypothetical protein
MERLQAISSGIWDFIVGDDWRTALGVGVAIALTALLAGAGVAAWWVMPLAVLLLLGLSLRRAVLLNRADTRGTRQVP